MQYNLAYDVSGHNVRNTTNWAIMLLLQTVVITRAERTKTFGRVFFIAYIKIK